MRRFLIVYFVVLGGLSALSLFPALVFYLFIITAGILGTIVIASNTVLLYSLASLPALAVLTLRSRPGLVRSTIALLLLAVPIAIAIVPGTISRQQVLSFDQVLSRGDFEKKPTSRPVHIAIALDGPFPYNYFVPADFRLPCDNVCQRLLFNYDVGSVRMVKLPDPARRNPGKTAYLSGATYSVEKRDVCPKTYVAGTFLDSSVYERIAAGECLIQTFENEPPVDTTVTRTTLFPGPSNAVNDEAPMHAKLNSLRLLTIVQQSGAASVAIMRRTEVKTENLAVPFYFGYVSIWNQKTAGPTLGREVQVFKPVEFADILHETFGFSVGPVEPPTAPTLASLPNRILSRSPTEPLTPEQQSVLADAVARLMHNARLSDTDIALMDRLLRDPRVSLPQLKWIIFQVYSKFADQMPPTAPPPRG